jgi:hypothetical protein
MPWVVHRFLAFSVPLMKGDLAERVLDGRVFVNSDSVTVVASPGAAAEVPADLDAVGVRRQGRANGFAKKFRFRSTGSCRRRLLNRHHQLRRY